VSLPLKTKTQTDIEISAADFAILIKIIQSCIYCLDCVSSFLLFLKINIGYIHLFFLLAVCANIQMEKDRDHSYEVSIRLLTSGF